MWDAVWKYIANPFWDVLDIANDLIRYVPCSLLFLIGVLATQGVLAVNASFDLGAAVAARELAHGRFLDPPGFLWTMGVATGLMVWGALSRVLGVSAEKGDGRRVVR